MRHVLHAGRPVHRRHRLSADSITRHSSYVLGDPNPDWTGSVRTNFRFGKLSVGGLLDIRHGGIAYNGTKGALNQFGTGLNTAQGRDGGPVIFGTNYQVNTIANDAVAGPGAGMAVPLNQSAGARVAPASSTGRTSRSWRTVAG